MIVTLNEKYEIVKSAGDNVVKGSDYYNTIALRLPKTLTNVYPTASFKRADGRVFSSLLHDKTEEVTDNEITYNSYIWTLSSSLLAVEGVLQVTFTLNFTDSSNNVTSQKNMVMCFVEVLEAVTSDNSIVIVGETSVTDLQTQLASLQSSVSTYQTAVAGVTASYLKSVSYDSSSYQFTYVMITNGDTSASLTLTIDKLYPTVEVSWDGVSSSFSLSSANSVLSTNNNTVLKISVSDGINSEIYAVFKDKTQDGVIYAGAVKTSSGAIKTAFFYTTDNMTFKVAYNLATIPTITATAETIEAGNSAEVSVSQSDEDMTATFHFKIPKGDDGVNGTDGKDGYGLVALEMDENGDLLAYYQGIESLENGQWSLASGNLVIDLDPTSSIKTTNLLKRW